MSIIGGSAGGGKHHSNFNSRYVIKERPSPNDVAPQDVMGLSVDQLYTHGWQHVKEPVRSANCGATKVVHNLGPRPQPFSGGGVGVSSEEVADAVYQTAQLYAKTNATLSPFELRALLLQHTFDSIRQTVNSGAMQQNSGKKGGGRNTQRRAQGGASGAGRGRGSSKDSNSKRGGSAGGTRSAAAGLSDGSLSVETALKTGQHDEIVAFLKGLIDVELCSTPTPSIPTEKEISPSKKPSNWAGVTRAGATTAGGSTGAGATHKESAAVLETMFQVLGHITQYTAEVLDVFVRVYTHIVDSLERLSWARETYSFRLLLPLTHLLSRLPLRSKHFLSLFDSLLRIPVKKDNSGQQKMVEARFAEKLHIDSKATYERDVKDWDVLLDFPYATKTTITFTSVVDLHGKVSVLWLDRATSEWTMVTPKTGAVCEYGAGSLYVRVSSPVGHFSASVRVEVSQQVTAGWHAEFQYAVSKALVAGAKVVFEDRPAYRAANIQAALPLFALGTTEPRAVTPSLAVRMLRCEKGEDTEIDQILRRMSVPKDSVAGVKASLSTLFFMLCIDSATSDRLGEILRRVQVISDTLEDTGGKLSGIANFALTECVPNPSISVGQALDAFRAAATLCEREADKLAVTLRSHKSSATAAIQSLDVLIATAKIVQHDQFSWLVPPLLGFLHNGYYLDVVVGCGKDLERKIRAKTHDLLGCIFQAVRSLRRGAVAATLPHRFVRDGAPHGAFLLNAMALLTSKFDQEDLRFLQQDIVPDIVGLLPSGAEWSRTNSLMVDQSEEENATQLWQKMAELDNLKQVSLHPNKLRILNNDKTKGPQGSSVQGKRLWGVAEKKWCLSGPDALPMMYVEFKFPNLDSKSHIAVGVVTSDAVKSNLDFSNPHPGPGGLFVTNGTVKYWDKTATALPGAATTSKAGTPLPAGAPKSLQFVPLMQGETIGLAVVTEGNSVRSAHIFKNGVLLGSVRDCLADELYVVAGVTSGSTADIRANFGPDFAFECRQLHPNVRATPTSHMISLCASKVFYLLMLRAANHIKMKKQQLQLEPAKGAQSPTSKGGPLFPAEHSADAEATTEVADYFLANAAAMIHANVSSCLDQLETLPSCDTCDDSIDLPDAAPRQNSCGPGALRRIEVSTFKHISEATLVTHLSSLAVMKQCTTSTVAMRTVLETLQAIIDCAANQQAPTGTTLAPGTLSMKVVTAALSLLDQFLQACPHPKPDGGSSGPVASPTGRTAAESESTSLLGLYSSLKMDETVKQLFMIAEPPAPVQPTEEEIKLAAEMATAVTWDDKKMGKKLQLVEGEHQQLVKYQDGHASESSGKNAIYGIPLKSTVNKGGDATASFSVKIKRSETRRTGLPLGRYYFIGVATSKYLDGRADFCDEYLKNKALLDPTSNEFFVLPDTFGQASFTGMDESEKRRYPENWADYHCSDKLVFVADDTITVKVNYSERSVAFQRNGRPLGTLYHDVPTDKPLFPFVTLFNGDASATITVHASTEEQVDSDSRYLQQWATTVLRSFLPKPFWGEEVATGLVQRLTDQNTIALKVLGSDGAEFTNKDASGRLTHRKFPEGFCPGPGSSSVDSGRPSGAAGPYYGTDVAVSHWPRSVVACLVECVQNYFAEGDSGLVVLNPLFSIRSLRVLSLVPLGAFAPEEVNSLGGLLENLSKLADVKGPTPSSPTSSRPSSNSYGGGGGGYNSYARSRSTGREDGSDGSIQKCWEEIARLSYPTAVAPLSDDDVHAMEMLEIEIPGGLNAEAEKQSSTTKSVSSTISGDGLLAFTCGACLKPWGRGECLPGSGRQHFVPQTRLESAKVVLQSLKLFKEGSLSSAQERLVPTSADLIKGEWKYPGGKDHPMSLSLSVDALEATHLAGQGTELPLAGVASDVRGPSTASGSFVNNCVVNINLQYENKPIEKKSEGEKEGAGGGEWACEICTFENAEDVTRCAMCTTARPGKTWSCASCTYAFNSLGSNQCEICGTRKMDPKAPGGTNKATINASCSKCATAKEVPMLSAFQAHQSCPTCGSEERFVLEDASSATLKLVLTSEGTQLVGTLSYAQETKDVVFTLQPATATAGATDLWGGKSLSDLETLVEAAWKDFDQDGKVPPVLPPLPTLYPIVEERHDPQPVQDEEDALLQFLRHAGSGGPPAGRGRGGLPFPFRGGGGPGGAPGRGGGGFGGFGAPPPPQVSGSPPSSPTTAGPRKPKSKLPLLFERVVVDLSRSLILTLLPKLQHQETSSFLRYLGISLDAQRRHGIPLPPLEASRLQRALSVVLSQCVGLTIDDTSAANVTATPSAATLFDRLIGFLTHIAANEVESVFRKNVNIILFAISSLLLYSTTNPRSPAVKATSPPSSRPGSPLSATSALGGFLGSSGSMNLAFNPGSLLQASHRMSREQKISLVQMMNSMVDTYNASLTSDANQNDDKCGEADAVPAKADSADEVQCHYLTKLFSLEGVSKDFTRMCTLLNQAGCPGMLPTTELRSMCHLLSGVRAVQKVEPMPSVFNTDVAGTTPYLLALPHSRLSDDGCLKVGQVKGSIGVFPSEGGCYYYELTVPPIQGGNRVAMGWGTNMHAVEKSTTHVGTDMHSWAYTLRSSVWILGGEIEYIPPARVNSGDVVGTLLDLNKKTVCWSLNGFQMPCVDLPSTGDGEAIFPFVSANVEPYSIKIALSKCRHLPVGYRDFAGGVAQNFRARSVEATSEDVTPPVLAKSSPPTGSGRGSSVSPLACVLPPTFDTKDFQFYKQLSAFVDAVSIPLAQLMDASRIVCGGVGAVSPGASKSGSSGTDLALLTKVNHHATHFDALSSLMPPSSEPTCTAFLKAVGPYLQHLTALSELGTIAGPYVEVLKGTKLWTRYSAAKELFVFAARWGAIEKLLSGTVNRSSERPLQITLDKVRADASYKSDEGALVVEAAESSEERDEDYTDDSGTDEGSEDGQPVPITRERSQSPPGSEHDNMPSTPDSNAEGWSDKEAVQASILGQLYQQTKSRDIFKNLTMFTVRLKDSISEDHGGLYRACFSMVGEELMFRQGLDGVIEPPRLPFFAKTDHSTYANIVPNRKTSREDLHIYHWLGKILGNAVITGSFVLALNFPRLLWKFLLEDEISIQDYYIDCEDTIRRSLEMDDFLLHDDAFFSEGLPNVRQWCEPGALVDMDSFLEGLSDEEAAEREKDVVKLRRSAAQKALIHQYDTQLTALRDGFCSIVPSQARVEMTWGDLQRRVCGMENISAGDFLAVTDLSMLKPEVRDTFVQALEGMTDQLRSRLLLFSAGQRRLPLPEKIKVHCGDTPESCPTAHTCSPITLTIQPYASAEVFRQKLVIAIAHAYEYGFV